MRPIILSYRLADCEEANRKTNSKRENGTRQLEVAWENFTSRLNLPSTTPPQGRRRRKGGGDDYSRVTSVVEEFVSARKLSRSFAHAGRPSVENTVQFPELDQTNDVLSSVIEHT